MAYCAVMICTDAILSVGPLWSNDGSGSGCRASSGQTMVKTLVGNRANYNQMAAKTVVKKWSNFGQGGPSRARRRGVDGAQIGQKVVKNWSKCGQGEAKRVKNGGLWVGGE